MIGYCTIRHSFVPDPEVSPSFTQCQRAYTWLSGRHRLMFRVSKYLRRLENNHSLAAKPPTRKTDLKSVNEVSGIIQTVIPP